MKTIILFSTLLSFSFSLLAQDFQGVATYKSQRKLDIKIDSTQMNSEIQQRIVAMMKKQFEKTHLLYFNKETSLYKEDKALEAPQPAGMEALSSVMNLVNSGMLYKNIKENRFSNKKETFSKVFLIKDSLQNHDWKLTNEKKYIGEYECFKATTKIDAPKTIIRSEMRVRDNKEPKTEEKQNTSSEAQPKEVIAWYTPKIPISNGPENYHGLPGLILEINDGTKTIVCSKIILNPEKKVSITEPKKGKLVNQKEYDVIIAKRMEESGGQFKIKIDLED